MANLLTRPVLALETLLANSESFQSWVSAADATEAAARIYNSAPTKGTRPLAIVQVGDEWSVARKAGGISGTFIPRGELLLRLDGPLLESDTSNGDAEMAYLDSAGDCIADLLSMSGQDGHLSIEEIEFDDDGPIRSTDDDETEDYIRLWFVVTWGI